MGDIAIKGRITITIPAFLVAMIGAVDEDPETEFPNTL